MVADTVAGAVGRHGLAAYLRTINKAIEALPPGTLFTRRFQVAGQSILAQFSDEQRADLHASRLPVADADSTGSAPEFRVAVIETAHLGWPAPARWHDPLADQHDFDKELDEAGLRVMPPRAPRYWEFMDRRINRTVQLTETKSDLPPWDAGAPLRIPLHWASLDRGRRVVHGATLGNEAAAVLLAGPGGAGKSATTLAGIAHGLRTVGDDYVIIEPGDPPVAWQAYRLLKQDAAGLARIPGLAERFANQQPNWQSKLEFDPQSVFPGCMAVRQPIRAVLVPQRGLAAETRIEPLHGRAGFDALARSTLMQFPTDRASGFLFCARLAKDLPSFSLRLSQSPKEIATKLRRFIEGLRS